MARPRIEPTDASHRHTLARWRVTDAKKHEPDLDPTAPLAGARARRREIERQQRRERTRRHLAKAAHVITCEWFDSIPPPPAPVYPQPVRRTDMFQAPPMRPVRDWRSLPIPDMWTRKPAPSKPQPTPTLYGTQYRSSGR